MIYKVTTSKNTGEIIVYCLATEDEKISNRITLLNTGIWGTESDGSAIRITFIDMWFRGLDKSYGYKLFKNKLNHYLRDESISKIFSDEN